MVETRPTISAPSPTKTRWMCCPSMVRATSATVASAGTVTTSGVIRSPTVSSLSSIRIRRSWRMFALAGVALLGAGLINEPWITLLVVSLGYLATVPFSMASYRKVRRRRATTLAEAELDYVTSARLRGEGALFTMTREILPNISGPIIVETTVRVGYAVFTIATLQFLLGGADPASPAWGNQVAQMYTYVVSGTWWPTVFPALALASLVIAVNLIADSFEAVYAT